MADTSLNPALAEARFCPRCGVEAVIDYPRRIACPSCGYEAYFNPKPVAATPPEATEVRAFSPHEIPWDELAFWSTERALRDVLA